ncbi:hypothetical protein [Azospirillum thermophilum]|uniref:Uncharacterized protein n=1 Tax=Azospirillum thermophilum TaxID=2202148 RepID=A0A2S2CPJ0_9PROT|nr:hypothetical protein [Azospirillum thermophilum]AWK86369.1 hypothetical protein DEW08_09055 [Azospirillum thermophilum]
MPIRRTSFAEAIGRAVHRLRTHSRSCHDLETRRLLIATERWLLWMLMRDEAETTTRQPDGPARVAAE